MLNKETIENNIKKIYKDLDDKLAFYEKKYDINLYEDELLDLIINRFIENSKVTREETVNFKINVDITDYSDLFRLMIMNDGLQVNTHLILTSNVKLDSDNYKYYKKRLLNLLKDNKHLNFEVVDTEFNNEYVSFNLKVLVDKEKIFKFIARQGVSAFAQKNLKSKAMIEPNGVKFEVFKNEVK